MKYTTIEYGSFITNFKKNLRPIYEIAITAYETKTGNNDLIIKDDAYWMNGHLDPSMNSLHYKGERHDITEFWNIYRSLKKTMDVDFNVST